MVAALSPSHSLHFSIHWLIEKPDAEIMSFPTDFPSSGSSSSFDDAQDTFNNAIDAQQRTLAIGVGVGVGLFVLFLAIAIWFFWRRSKKRKERMNENAQRMNEQTCFARPQPDMHHRYGQPTYGQQTYGQPSQERRREEVDGLAYSQYQEMNAHSANTPYQGGQVVEAQDKIDPQEMPLSYRQNPPQEMPGGGRR